MCAAGTSICHNITTIPPSIQHASHASLLLPRVKFRSKQMGFQLEPCVQQGQAYATTSPPYHPAYNRGATGHGPRSLTISLIRHPATVLEHQSQKAAPLLTQSVPPIKKADSAPKSLKYTVYAKKVPKRAQLETMNRTAKPVLSVTESTGR